METLYGYADGYLISYTIVHVLTMRYKLNNWNIGFLLTFLVSIVMPPA